MSISAVVLTKNEEHNIIECLKSISFCDELIVIDDNSTDRTKKLAKNHGATVYKRALNSNFAEQRNFGLEKAKGKWVLFVDADERISPELASEITNFINDPTQHHRGAYLKRRDIFLGKKLKHGEAGNIKLLRLARRGAGEWKRRVHEYWDVTGSLYLLKNPILHQSHPSLHEFISDINSLSTLHALANKEEDKKTSIFKIIVWPVLKFLNNYVLKRGFMDGTHGFVYAMVMSFHSYLSWSKLWILQKNQP